MAKRRKSSSKAKAAVGELKPEECPAGMKLLRQFEPHGGSITGISFRPDGRQFVTASSDHTLKIWDAVEGKEIRPLTGHGAEVWALAFSQDGTRIVSGSHDQTVKLWDVSSLPSAGSAPTGKALPNGWVIHEPVNLGPTVNSSFGELDSRVVQ